MLRDLLLPTTGTPGDANAIDAAVVLAREFDAHLSLLETVSLPMFTPSPWGFTPDALLTDLYAQLEAVGRDNVDALHSRMSREGISCEVRLAETGFVARSRAIAMQARHTDLGIMTAPTMPSATDNEIVESIFAGMLFESGRPVLVLPPHYPLQWPLRRVVIAWCPTREATRAVHDAMPLLMRTERVDVVTIDAAQGEAPYGDLAGADIGAHLARHGLEVEVVGAKRGTGTIATALLSYAAETEAQLLVAGGFGHSRLREWVIGGTTSDLLGHMDLPVLFSH
jgi:nucleotide-binding universal stress UspA family protein